MLEAIVSGVFGALTVGILVYLVARIDRLTDEIRSHGERLAHIEGMLEEHLREHHQSA